MFRRILKFSKVGTHRRPITETRVRNRQPMSAMRTPCKFDAEGRYMRHHWQLLTIIVCALLAAPASAQQEAVHWHSDLESAKMVAKETGRLVLVHFWTPSCGPCMALNQNVFNQPGVASAIEQQFVPVKLNADENSATAQWFGISRVPTDVIVTPDGQLVGKLISPPTPAAYVAEVTAAAGKYTSRSGQTYAKAATAAPMQPQLNSAYAGLQISPDTPMAVGPAQQLPPQKPLSVPTAGQGNIVDNPPARGKHHRAAMAAAGTDPGQPQSPAITPQVVANPSAGAVGPPSSLAIATPAAMPNAIANPYLMTAAVPSPVPRSAVSPLISPADTTPIATSNSTVAFGAAGAANVAAYSVGLGDAFQRSIADRRVPDLRQLPAGAPPLGFDGYCPVSMRNSWKWIAGDPRWGVVHRGRTYWFAGPEEQKQFWTDPDRYTPALSGIDPVLAIDHQQQVPGKREHSLDYDGLFYMFASEATLQQFTANPQRYAAGVRQAMGIPRGRLVR